MHIRSTNLRGLPRATLSLRSDKEPLPCNRCPGRPFGICAPFDDDALSSLVAMAGQRNWDRRQLLYHAGDPAKAVYKIKKGIVIEYDVLTDGRRQIVAILSIGDMLGYPTPDGRHDLTAQAISPVEACAFGLGQFRARVAHDVEFASAMADDLVQRLKQAVKRLTTIGQLVSIERVARFTLAMEELHRLNHGDIGAIALHLNRQEIGDYLGLTLETVSRSFAKLKDKGALALVGKDAVSVVNRERLLQVAKLN